MDQIITPAEALFAWYRLGFELDSVIVYNMPTDGVQTERGTRYFITSPDRRVPDEIAYFGRDADGTPICTGVDDE